LSEIVTIEELSASGFFNSKMIERYGADLVQLLASEDAPSKELVKSLQRPSSDTNEMVTLIQVFHSFCNSLAMDHGIDPTLLFNKSEVFNL